MEDNLAKEAENSSNTNGSTGSIAIYSDDKKMQTEEFEQNKKSNHTKEDNAVTPSGINDLQSNINGAATADGSGTTERKKFGDTELNKGLEAQAREEES